MKVVRFHIVDLAIDLAVQEGHPGEHHTVRPEEAD